MTSIVNISSYKAQRIRTLSRVVNLIIGIGLPIMMLQYPPAKPTWLVMGFVLSIVLVSFSIVGLWPKLKVSILGHVFDNRVVHATTSSVIGILLILMAISNPPVLREWFAFYNAMGILLILDAIISTGYLMKAKKSGEQKVSNIHQHGKAA